MDPGNALLDYLQFVLGHLVEHPEEASIRRRQRENGDHIFTVSLHEEDLGRVIGRNGRTIRAIRNLLNAGAAHHGTKAVLKIGEAREEP